MTAWLWTAIWVELYPEVLKLHPHNVGYVQGIYINYYKKTFDYKAEIRPELKITEKYWWEL